MKSPKDKRSQQNKKAPKENKKNIRNPQNSATIEEASDSRLEQKDGTDTGAEPALKSGRLNSKKGGIKRLILFTLAVSVIAMIIFIISMVYIYSITPPDSHGTFVDSIRFMVSPGQTAFQGKDKMIILCLGVDQNWTERNIMYTKNARTDTIILVSLDNKAEALNVLSIPRDTWVQLSETQGYDKINSAYAFGGINQAKKCIENFLGINIDHYVLLKVKTTENMVNAIGGVEVDVEKNMDYDDNWGHLHVHLKKGPQILNGQQAVGYARFRHDEEGDWGRIRRQQQVINAMIREMRKPANLLRMDKIAKVIHDGIETDMSLTQLLDLARLYKEFDRKNMKAGTIKGDDAATADGVSIIKPYEEEKNALVRKLLLRDIGIDPSQIRIGILNGSGIEGSALKLADMLGKKGYKIVRVADADRKDYACTKLIDHLNDSKMAATFDEYVGPNEYVADEAKNEEEDITIIIGKNWVTWQESKKNNASDSPQSKLNVNKENNKEYSQKISPVPETSQNPDNTTINNDKPAVDSLKNEPGNRNDDIDVQWSDSQDNKEKTKVVSIPKIEEKVPQIEKPNEKITDFEDKSKTSNKRDFPSYPTPIETANIPNIPKIDNK